MYQASMLKFSLLFLAIIASLFLLQITQVAQDAVITPFTAFVASISAWVVQLFDPEVIAVGNKLGNAAIHKRIEIVPGCNGVEAMIILFAGIVAFPASVWYKVKGLFWGFLAIHSLNSIRIVSLFYLLQWDEKWFEFFHMYIWQALIILDALVVWLIWLRYLPANQNKVDRSPDLSSSTPSESAL